FFLLVGDVAALAGFAQAVALGGVRQNQRRPPLGVQRLLVGVEDLFGIVTAALQLEDFLVAEVRYQFEQFGVLAEKVLPDVGAVFGDVGLELAIHHFAHAFLQQSGGVARQ